MLRISVHVAFEAHDPVGRTLNGGSPEIVEPQLSQVMRVNGENSHCRVPSLHPNAIWKQVRNCCLTFAQRSAVLHITTSGLRRERKAYKTN